jgi:hypothetical protein
MSVSNIRVALQVTCGVHIGQIYFLDESVGSYSIGRDEAADIRLTDRGISRRHASLTFCAGHWFLADAHSANGTFLNCNRIAHSALQPGDSVVVGIAELEVLALRGSPAAEPEPEPEPEPAPEVDTSTIRLPKLTPVDMQQSQIIPPEERKAILQAMVNADGNRAVAAATMQIPLEEFEEKLSILHGRRK